MYNSVGNGNMEKLAHLEYSRTFKKIYHEQLMFKLWVSGKVRDNVVGDKKMITIANQKGSF